MASLRLDLLRLASLRFAPPRLASIHRFCVFGRLSWYVWTCDELPLWWQWMHSTLFPEVEEVDDDAEVDESGIEPKDIELVISQVPAVRCF